MVEYRRIIFAAIIVTTLGVVFSTILRETGSLGTVFIAIGGLLLIIGMKRKKDQQ